MKTFIAVLVRPALLIILLFLTFGTSFGQSSKKTAKNAQKEVEVKNWIDTKSYVFVAEYVQPLRGGNRYVTPDYDLRVGADSLVAYLPYFGRAFIAPYNPTEGGVKFTTTKFDYKTTESKDGWDIIITPKSANDVRRMDISISKNGYATLRVTCDNRDAISYQGYIEAKKQKG